jgi:hypothetical protein
MGCAGGGAGPVEVLFLYTGIRAARRKDVVFQGNAPLGRRIAILYEIRFSLLVCRHSYRLTLRSILEVSTAMKF